VRRSSFFDLDGPIRPFTPREFRAQIGVSSPRTVAAYRERKDFPQGRLVRHGRVEVRVWDVDDVARAQSWLISRGLPGPRARRRLEHLEEARAVKLARLDLEQLAGRLVHLAGAAALVDCLFPLGHHACGLKAIPKGEIATARAAIVRAIELRGGRP